MTAIPGDLDNKILQARSSGTFIEWRDRHPACGDIASSLLQAADAALCRSKLAGKARIELCDGAGR